MQLQIIDPEFTPLYPLDAYLDLSHLSSLAVEGSDLDAYGGNWSDLGFFNTIPTGSLRRLAIKDVWEDAVSALLEVLRQYTALEELVLSLDETVDCRELMSPLAFLPRLRALTVHGALNLDGLLNGLGKESYSSIVELSVKAGAGIDDVFGPEEEDETDIEPEHELGRLALALVRAHGFGLLPSLQLVRLDRTYDYLDFRKWRRMPGMQAVAQMLRDVGLDVVDHYGLRWRDVRIEESRS